MKHIKKTITLLGVVLVLFGCSKDDDAPVVVPIPQNIAPQIDNQEFSISESATEGTAIGTLVAADVNEDQLTYTITTNDNDLFAITDAGSLSLATGKTVNYDVAQTHSITVAVSDGTDTASATITINVTNIVDVYAAGYENKGGDDIATFWKNGEAISLTDGSNEAKANSVFVSGDDVYVAGYEVGNSGFEVATLWRNGETIKLTDGNSDARANAVYVSGNDVYVVGYRFISSRIFATLWKNQVQKDIGDIGSSANAVYVSGDDVYIVGYQYGESKSVATLWRNEEEIALTDGVNNAFANDVYISGTDVYIAGIETNLTNGIATLWKNGAATMLTDGNGKTATSVFVSGNDVYVVGSNNFWQNNVLDSLSQISAQFSSVYVFENDVYISGTLYSLTNQKYEASIWKNSEQTVLSGEGNITAVFVK
ncbi:cadherin domain-containing protein [Aquimarina algiphila]|uniref:cadherin domain-containing protein n=1 Tax=Aquimarina algiphila TaxID=2047982 RepID=UPI00233072BE|nr:cadherin domain-containing protein [Aquimarina algiphila]